jgi:hypothetical protein
MFTTGIRRWAAFARSMREFSSLCRQDQSSLLQSAVMQLSILRAVASFQMVFNLMDFYCIMFYSLTYLLNDKQISLIKSGASIHPSPSSHHRSVCKTSKGFFHRNWLKCISLLSRLCTRLALTKEFS